MVAGIEVVASSYRTWPRNHVRSGMLFGLWHLITWSFLGELANHMFK